MAEEEETPILKPTEQKKSGEFTLIQVVVLCCLCFTSFVVNSVSSLASPFYPSDANKFGVTESVIGIILGLYSLTVFFVAPLVPMLIAKLSVESTFKIGIILSGVSAMVFGFINKCTHIESFVTISVILRILQGCGCAFVDTSLYAIIADRYPKNLGKVTGLITLSVGLGFMVGPPLGGFLYSAGGFYLPFVVMGSLTLLMGICIIFGMPDGPECTKRTRQYSVYAYIESDGLEQSIVTGYTNSLEGASWYSRAKDIPVVPSLKLDDQVSLFDILADVKCLTILATTIIGSAILGFQEPNLGLYLEKNGYQSTAVGGFFLLRDFFFAVGSIFAGYMVDSVGPYSILAGGMFMGSIGYLALGPIPPFTANLTSIIAGLVITGFAGSIPWVSGLPSLLKATRHLGNKRSLNSQLSGLQNSCLYFGIFVGSILGGVFLDMCSFRMTYLYFSILPAGMSVLFSCGMLLHRSRGSKTLEESMKA